MSRAPIVAVGVGLFVAAGTLGTLHLSRGEPAAGGGTEIVFDAVRGLGEGWHDLGWAPREINAGQPAKLDLSGRAGWIVARAGVPANFSSLVVRYKAPPNFGDFLELAVGSPRPGDFPRVTVTADRRRDVGAGWWEAVVPLRALDPAGVPFEQIILRARTDVGHERVLVQRITLTAEPSRAEKRAPSTTAAAAAATPPAPAASPVSTTLPGRAARFALDCRAPGRPISPLIYGVGGSDKSGAHWEMGIAAQRWGGNPSTRYNWQLGNAWNAGSDWFFRNVDYANNPAFSYDRVLTDNLAHGVTTALTVPTIGWVAKDTTSYSFPVSTFGPQAAVAPENADMGNGKSKSGALLTPGPPTRTSVLASPDFIGKWIATIRQKDKQRGRSVKMVILDNEPMLWHVTHRDVHPDPVGYDELLTRSVAYATAVRKADPGVLIAGPAEWGWTGFFYSAVDMAAGYRRAPDRRAHGDVPLLPWWLSRMRAEERRSGLKLLDVLDVHYYPAAGNSDIGVESTGATDRATNALRLRSTRSLWDAAYLDESWIKDRVELIPRLRRWVAENAPGIGIALGEYSFGAAEHQSGGLAQAEALGRFGTEGLLAAFYWFLPPKNSPTYWAFRAFRNFDGQGGRFLDLSVPVETRATQASLFASRSASGDHLVAVLLNLDPDEPLVAAIDLSRCGGGLSERAFAYRGGAAGFAPAGASTGTGTGVLTRSAPPYSITVLEWKALARSP